MFVHIPEPDLHIILAKLSRRLRLNEICLIRPDVFTGVCGGRVWEQLRSDGLDPSHSALGDSAPKEFASAWPSRAAAAASLDGLRVVSVELLEVSNCRKYRP